MENTKTKTQEIRPSINQKCKKYFNPRIRYTEDGACAYCGYGPNNPHPLWVTGKWQCTLTHSADDPSKAKYTELWNKICAQDDYCPKG